MTLVLKVSKPVLGFLITVLGLANTLLGILLPKFISDPVVEAAIAIFVNGVIGAAIALLLTYEQQPTP